ncbi:putative ABC transporter ATP-binding protein y4oS [Streptomyces afghaniensis 772]|uniref:Putative ABC transporter ATP-binding protein y4oS n=1 Tax=Streptomyces afghaniensis 772 TaxID=1283301 RepID=S4MY42_9ACTN|nr:MULTISPECIES: ABC transporter ATP-binding protein [Streptomyces]EPJ38852.1 putative ABC transporter ATP-binding protein y4oS [Streptomyces afghaniensis 772]UOB12907.1 ABC transporter ATP-binding protein [Streptomyces sp. HP-A2021]
MTELELRDLRKTYRARGRPGVDAVRGLDLGLRSGELLGLLGPSGCGKSTTLRMIAGLESVTGGDILVGGASVVERPAQQRNIGVAFENYALYPPLSVAENLAFGLKARGRKARGDVDRKVKEIAERVGLTDLLGARPAGLSSGQKQRVSLARALIREPDVLLLDEPLSHLDAAQRDTTRRELKRIQKDLGHTTILVTHDQEEALSLADRIAVMKDGVIQQLGTPYEIYDSPVNVFVADFVGEPAITLLPGIAGADGRARLSDSVRIALPVPVQEGREVVVGIRPEDVRLTAEEGLPARVVAHEPLLESGLATLALDGVERHLVVLTDPEVRLAHDERVRVAADLEHTHVFDAETGEALR